jgi:4-aminobutyrate aminotransferase-like enzyme
MGNILTLTPALTLTEAELDQALAILDVCIGEVEAKVL